MKKLFYSLLALPVLMVACGEKSEAPVEQPKGATLELTSAETMEFDAEGGEGTITFDYDGNKLNTNGNSEPTTGKVLTIECAAEWITVASEVDVLASAINFEVAANETEEAREAVIKAYIKDLFIEVTIKQAAKENGGNDDPIDDPNDDPKEDVVEGWAINGTMNNWAKAEAIAMTEEDGFFVVKGFELAKEDNFNFILNGGEKSYGGNGVPATPNYVYDAKSWGSNISVAEAGTYDIYLSTDLKNYYIMSEGVSPSEAEVPLKPGEKRWSIKGNIMGYDDVEISLAKDSKYFTKKNVQFVDDVAEFAIYCNSEAVYGVESGSENAIEEAMTIVEGGEAIKLAVTEGAKYDLYYKYNESGASQLWVMPASQYPVVWELVSGGYMPYGNFLCYFVSEDVELTLDFTAGVSVVNYVMPEGVYYVQDTEETGFCFDLQYCQAKVRGFKTMLMDGTMTVKHENGLYDIFIDMRTPQLDIIKMHWVGEFAFDQYFQMMGGLSINNPEK